VEARRPRRAPNDARRALLAPARSGAIVGRLVDGGANDFHFFRFERYGI
jgi:hypothetical protein